METTSSENLLSIKNGDRMIDRALNQQAYAIVRLLSL